MLPTVLFQRVFISGSAITMWSSTRSEATFSRLARIEECRRINQSINHSSGGTDNAEAIPLCLKCPVIGNYVPQSVPE